MDNDNNIDKPTRQEIREAVHHAIKTNDFTNFPDDISNSIISNDSHISDDNKKKCFNCFFKKNKKII